MSSPDNETESMANNLSRVLDEILRADEITIGKSYILREGGNMAIIKGEKLIIKFSSRDLFSVLKTLIMASYIMS